MAKGKLKFFSIFLVLLLTLAACSSGAKDEGGDKDQQGGDDDSTVVDPTTFPKTVKNDDAEIEGGTLNYGLVSSSPFEGTLDWQFYQGAPDAEILSFFSEPIFGYDEYYRMSNEVESAAKFELLDDGKKIKVMIQDGVYWHDGKPLKAEDYAYSFEIIGHPDYTGVRYGDAIIQSIVGMKEYHAGEVDSISGIEIIDDKTLTIEFEKANPSLLTGLWPYAAPKHHYGDVPIKDLATSDKIHIDVIGFGPFKVNNIVPGESVEFVAFENYYGGKPKLDSIILKVVDPSKVKKELENGSIDIAEFPTDQYDPAYEPTNFQFLATMDNAYTYIGFKLGRWDAENKVAVQDKDTPLQDVALRQAIGYAMDNETVGKEYYNGLRIPASTLMIPFFKDYHNPDIEGYNYDPEKAKQILADAGYKDTNGDGFVETPDGEELKLTFLSMSGGDTAEPLAKFYIQNWKDVGINVELFEGRLHEFNSFYDLVGRKGNDDPNVDLYQGAWGTGTDPDPYGLYSKTALFNFPRYVNEENEKLLEEGNSEKALDPEYRKEVYDKWQQLMIDNPPVIPTLYRYALTAVNNRVKNYTLENGTDWGLEDISLTSDTPFKN
ncbi:oligopeptide ABC transporter substrate-binding protein [Fervidibacillus halotolerans]|uniref:Oligopeptide ABC transporter substrate-binding protein n=1 Tax=Fervidibacillus halotolerans TaxID=2980027 RepID=A0A9E8LY96_9BACI|nr:oligopeptide ABC transporter substrate-binding protein [Fervidibacillus halotolerans]WAA11781.1 oligopeptide ABC transporter substrate-binding protein [Fervidibacillus halotolerans]